MQENYNDWNRALVVTPPKGERILVSDGEVQVIATLVENTWFFDNHTMKEMPILWWKELPNDPPRIVSSSAEKSLTT